MATTTTTPSADVWTVTAAELAAHTLAQGLAPHASSPITVVLGNVDGTKESKAEVTPPRAEFREALEVAAQPNAMVRLLSTGPGDRQDSVSIVVRGDRAAAFSVDGGILQLGPAQDLKLLAEALPGSLAYEGPLAGRDVSVWPSSLKVVTALWAKNGDPSVALPKAALLDELAKGSDLAGAEALLKEVTASGTVTDQGATLAIPEELRPWLALLWSGQAAQVEYLPLDPFTPLEAAAEGQGQRLVFFGPPGQRVLNRVVGGAELAALFADGEPAEDTVVQFSAPPVAVVASAVRQLLRVEPAA